MTDPTPTAADPPPRFPYLTAGAAGLALFLFVGLVLVVYRSPNYLGGGPAGEPKPDPVTKLNEVRARSQAVVDGTDPSAKLSVDRAAAGVLAHAAKTKDGTAKFGRLPFPAEPKPAAPEKERP